MRCAIQNCQISDASFLMQCTGSCGRSFHAACAGTQRNYEEVITQFMIPLCQDCQGVHMADISTRSVLIRQQTLTSTIEGMIDANHKACSSIKQMDIKTDTLQGACEGIVNLLCEIQKQIDKLEKRIDDSAVNIYSKVLSFFDEAAPVDNANTAAKIDTLTSATHKIGEGQSVIDERLQVINEGLINLSERNQGPTVVEILEEIKAISANLPVEKQRFVVNERHKTLAEELATASNSKDNSGWRILGNKKHWKPDWSDYDSREAHRKEQSKLQRKANQRKRRRQRRRSNLTEYSNLDNNFHLEPNYIFNSQEHHSDRLHNLYLKQIELQLRQQPGQQPNQRHNQQQYPQQQLNQPQQSNQQQLQQPHPQPRQPQHPQQYHQQPQQNLQSQPPHLQEQQQYQQQIKPQPLPRQSQILQQQQPQQQPHLQQQQQHQHRQQQPQPQPRLPQHSQHYHQQPQQHLQPLQLQHLLPQVQQLQQQHSSAE